jgi:hypothetical protein
MDRREFLKRLAGIGAAGAALLLDRGENRSMGPRRRESLRPRALPDLVAVKGGESAAMFDRAIKELGGMGAFVRKGPNGRREAQHRVGTRPPEGGPRPPIPPLVKRIVEHCLESGAKKVWVFDNSCDNGPRCYASSKIASYAKEGRRRRGPRRFLLVLPRSERARRGQAQEDGRPRDHPRGPTCSSTFPYSRTTRGAGMTCAMKNLMGIVWGQGGLPTARTSTNASPTPCLFRKPALNVVDAWKVMLSGGPRGYAGSRYDEQRMLMLSTDPRGPSTPPSAKILGKSKEDFGYIAKAEEGGIGRADLAKLNILRLTM